MHWHTTANGQLFLRLGVIILLVTGCAMGARRISRAARPPATPPMPESRSAAGGCEAPGLQPGDYQREIQTAGLSRAYKLHVPPSYRSRQRAPVVLVLHGGGGDADHIAKSTQMNEISNREGFLVAYPQGTGRFRGRLLTYNAGDCCGYAKEHNIDDVAFVSALLNDLQRVACIDSKRVYATGFSNGALMSYRLACELADRIAAVSPVSGPMGVNVCNPTRPVSVLHFHGTADDNAKYNGGPGGRSLTQTNFRSVPETIQGWVRRDACDATSVKTRREKETTCETYTPCHGGAEVTLCTIQGGTHQWPDPRLTGEPASEVIWKFFLRHSME